MDYDILFIIAQNKDEFSKLEREIGDFIVADPEWVMNSTISEFAAKCKVSPPTISRFIKKSDYLVYMYSRRNRFIRNMDR